MDGDISSMIGKIMADPSFAEMVGRLKGDGTSPDEIRDSISEKMPGIMEMASPLLESFGAGNAKEMPDEEKKSGASSEISGGKEEKDRAGIVQVKYDKVRAEKLLCALKPYLNKNRCGIIDKCVSVMQITDVVSALGGFENLLKNSMDGR